MKEGECICEAPEILLFACSGESNVGQIANEAAKNLTTSGKGKMYCLAGIGGHVDAMIETTRTAKRVVAIDGCPVHCVKKALEHVGFDVDVHVVVTELEIEKRYDYMMDYDEIKKVEDAVEL